MFKRILEYKFIEISQKVIMLMYNGNEPVFRVEHVIVNTASWWVIPSSIKDVAGYINDVIHELQPIIDLWNAQDVREWMPQEARDMLIKSPGEYKIERRTSYRDYGLSGDDCDDCPF